MIYIKRIPVKTIVLISAVFVVAVWIGSFLILRNHPKSNSKKISEEAVTAQDTINCLDKLRDKRGAYYVDNQNNVSNTAGIYVLLARTRLYDSTGDLGQLNEIDKDLNIYTDKSKVGAVQTDMGARDFLYEMWQSSLPSPQKEKILNLAKRVDPRENLILYKIFNTKGSDTEVKNLATLKGNTESVIPNINHEFVRTVTLSSDYLSWYLWQKNPDDLKNSKLIYLETVKAFNTGKYKQMAAANSLALVSLRFYKLEKDKKYLDYAMKIINEVNFPAACNVLNSCTFDNFSSYISISLAEELNRIKPDIRNSQLKQIIIKKVKDQSWDKNGYPRFSNGDSCFFDGRSSVKSVVGNALLVSAFLSQQ